MFHHCAFAWKTMKERPFAWRVVYPKRYHHSSSSFLTIFPQKCQAKNHDGSGQKFLLTSDSIWPQLMQALVIIMVCKLGGTSSISAEKFVNPWKISIMSEPIITRDAGMKISKAFFSSLQKFVRPKRSNRSTWLIDCSKLGFLISVSLITSVSYGVSS